MKKRYYISIIIVSLFFFGCKKNVNLNDGKSSDSLAIYIDQIKKSEVKSATKLRYTNKLFESVTATSNTQINRDYLNQIASSFYNLNEKEKFKKASFALLKKAIKENDTLNTAIAYKNLGSYYIETAKNDSSYYFYIKAEKVVRNLQDNSMLGNIYLDIAFIKLYESDFSGSEISASKSLAYLDKNTNTFNVYDAFNLIAVCSNELKNYDKALEYHNKALKHCRDYNLKSKYHLDANSLNNIGYVYQNMGENEKAIMNFRDALSNKMLFKDNPGLYAMLLDNLAYSKFKLKDFKQLPDLFYKSLAIRDSLNTDPSGIILNRVHLSELYFYQKDTLKAKSIAKETLVFARNKGVPSDILVSLKQISAVDLQNAGKYSEEYIKINDSVQQLERNARDKFARIAYETKEISLEKDKLEEQNRNLLYFFVGTLMIGLLLFVIRTQRAKNRELLLKQAQQKANEDIYNLMITQQNRIEESRIKEKKRIAQELHDGVLGRLFGARLNLDSLNRMTDEEAMTKRNNYLSELKNIEQDIREISHDLNREKYVLINNFVAILNNLLEEQKNSFGAEVVVTIDDKIKWEAVSNALKINLYRIIQESLQNINKYAQANMIKLDIKKISDNLIVSVTDDGVGFAVNNKKKGIGLQNMLSRANDLDGVFDIRSKKGKGTTITVTFPIENKQTISEAE